MKAIKTIVTTLFLLGFAWTVKAAVITQTTILAEDPASLGQIQITSTVYDNYLGDFTKWQFDYEIQNISYDPTPGQSNGLSGFNLVFPNAVTVFDQYAPPNWFFNCCGTVPPFGAEYDIDNSSGFGIPIGVTDNVGFTTQAGLPFTDSYFGSWAHSWVSDIQTFTFNQVDIASGLGPIVPDVPLPAAVWLFGSGLLILVGFRKHQKAHLEDD